MPNIHTAWKAAFPHSYAVIISLQTVEEEEPVEEEETAEDADTEKAEEEEDEDAKVEEEAEKEKKTKKVSKTVWDWELMNSVKPIWTRKYVSFSAWQGISLRFQILSQLFVCHQSFTLTILTFFPNQNFEKLQFWGWGASWLWIWCEKEERTDCNNKSRKWQP